MRISKKIQLLKKIKLFQIENVCSFCDLILAIFDFFKAILKLFNQNLHLRRQNYKGKVKFEVFCILCDLILAQLWYSKGHFSAIRDFLQQKFMPAALKLQERLSPKISIQKRSKFFSSRLETKTCGNAFVA